jgi:hypothetical protein
MKIKTNLRAGSGGASGAGKNSTRSTDPIVYLNYTTGYVDPTIGVTRCVGI